MSKGEYSEQRERPLAAIVRRLHKGLRALRLRVEELEQAQSVRDGGPLARVQAATIALAARLSKAESQLRKLQARAELERITTPPPADAPGPYSAQEDAEGAPEEEEKTGDYNLQERLSASQKRLAAYDAHPPQQTQPMAKEPPAQSGTAHKTFVKPKKVEGADED